MRGKIAHVLRKLDPREWGGTETHVMEITRRLGAHGWPCEVHAPSGPETAGRCPLEVPLLRYRAYLPFLGPREARRGLLANAGNLISFEEPWRLARDRSLVLVHLHTTGRIGGGVRVAMKWTGRPYIVSVHGPMLANREWLARDTARRLEGVVDLGKPIGALFGSRQVLDDAARVIAFNREEHDAIRQRVGARAVRMDHGVDASRFEGGSASEARERWGLPREVPILAVVGRVCAQKNQVLAVQAFSRGAPPQAHLLLAGAPTDVGYRELVEGEARSLGVAERVHLLGNIRPADVPDLFAVASLVLVPSTHEAFGLAVLEGWAAKKAVLFPRHSGLADLADAIGKEHGVLPTLDVDVWSTAIASFLRDDSRKSRLIDAAQRLVRERFHWSRITARLAEIYDEVTKESFS